MSETPARPYWQWLLLAIAPGLICDAIAALGSSRSSGSDLQGLIMLILLSAPVWSLIYLVWLGQRYVAQGLSKSGSVLGFVLGYGALNVLLWGAGCAIVMSGVSIH